MQRYDKKSIHFWSSSKMKDWLKYYMLSDATFNDRLNTIYQIIKSLLDKKCLFLWNIEPLGKSNVNMDNIVIE